MLFHISNSKSLADKPIETSQTEKQRDKRMKNTRTEYLSTANFKSCNIQVMGIPKGEETKKGKEEIFEIFS